MMRLNLIHPPAESRRPTKGLSDQQQSQVKAAATTLRIQFDKIHEGFHGNEIGTSYDDVSDEMENAIRNLTDILEEPS